MKKPGRAALCWWVAAALAVSREGRAQAPPTFADVAPIVHARCGTCHRPGGDAPFSLMTFEEVRARAAQIAAVTRSGYMPPWKPLDPAGVFQGDRRLTPGERELLERWLGGGLAEGPKAANPPTPPTWMHGTPDLVVQLPPFVLDADGGDVFRNFVVPAAVDGLRYVGTFEFRPGNPAVHHANIRLDRTPASRALDAADPLPGYEGLVLHSAEYPDGHFLGWTPGQAAPPVADLSWRLDPGSDFVVQLHMQATGKAERIAPVIGLYFSRTPPARTPSILRLGRQSLDIPAGANDYRSHDAFVLPVAADVRAIQPHAHQRAREVAAWATLPDGTTRSLIRIGDWDFRWQDHYRYAAALRLPAGTRLNIEYRFDNSPANVRNPVQPPRRAIWGWRSIDEMGDVWIQMIADHDADRARLDAAIRRKMLEEDAVGSEVLIGVNPGHAALRNDAALINLELGRLDKAIEQFREVVRLDGRSASAHYNLATALEAAARRTEAIAAYERAVDLNPAYSAAHNNLANLYLAEGRRSAAHAAYERAVAADPANADALFNLGRLNLETGNHAAAFDAMRRAAAQTSDRAPSMLAVLAWLLATLPDTTPAQHAEAVTSAERAVALAGSNNPGALDVLAAAYARAGRFDEAVATVDSALASGAAAPELVEALRRRRAIYSSGKPFIEHRGALR